MLPGFRFLFAAIMLSMSVLIFGLGAAAVLRAAHEEVAGNPSWRAAPELMFAQPAEVTKPVLAMLRVDMPPAEEMQDDAPAIAAPVEQAAIISTSAETERAAPLKVDDSSPAAATGETANIESPIAENPAASEAEPASAEMPALADETRVATIATDEISSRESQTVSAPSEPVDLTVTPTADLASTKIATLGGPPVNIETPPPAKISQAKPDQNTVRKRQQAEQAAAHRKRLALERARLAAQPANLFGQPAPTIRNR
jgi:hypothetical protein